MKMNDYTKELKKELMEEFERVCAELQKGHMDEHDAHWAVIDEADELFDTCLDQHALLMKSGKEFDEEPYNDFLAWITFDVLLNFEWEDLYEYLNSEREAA